MGRNKKWCERVSMIEIDNFREITKKDKVYLPRTNIGLSRNSLLIVLLGGGVLWLIFV